MIMWVLFGWVSLHAGSAVLVPGIKSEAECLAIARAIEREGKVRCIPYRIE